MNVDLSKVKIYIRPEFTDLRKAVNGLTVLIQESMQYDPFTGSVYLFCNRERKLLKVIWWDKTYTQALPIRRGTTQEEPEG